MIRLLEQQISHLVSVMCCAFCRKENGQRHGTVMALARKPYDYWSVRRNCCATITSCAQVNLFQGSSLTLNTHEVIVSRGWLFPTFFSTIACISLLGH